MRFEDVERANEIKKEILQKRNVLDNMENCWRYSLVGHPDKGAIINLILTEEQITTIRAMIKSKMENSIKELLTELAKM
jgi:hypothetical protein